MGIRMHRLTSIPALALTAALALGLPCEPAASAQSGAGDELRGANYVYARPRGRTAKAQPKGKYKRKSGKVETPDLADARIGVTLWRAEVFNGTDPSGTRDIVQVGSKTSAWTLARVSSDDLLDTGEMFRVGIETLRSGYLYVVNRPVRADGTTGDPYLIYPTRRIRLGDNRVIAGRMTMIPTPPDEPPFQATDPYGDVVGEELIIVVSPEPLDVETREDRYRFDSTKLETWLKDWSAPTESFELVGGAGTYYTRVEKAAATNPKRLLTTTEPLPQFVHRIAAKAGEPMLARVIVQIRQPQAKR